MRLKDLWRDSLTFRRIIVVLVTAVLALAAQLATSIHLTSPLEDPGIDKLAASKPAEHLRIFGPKIDAGGLVLSFSGALNVRAEVWTDNATLTGSSTMFAALAPPGPVSAVYATQAGKTDVKDCRTELAVSRPASSAAIQTLDLWQTDIESDQQRFRQIVVSSPQTALQVEVSTNSSDGAVGACPRALSMGTKQISIPAGPVFLLVPANTAIKLRFSSADPAMQSFTSSAGTFDGLSLGSGTIKADGLDVIAIPEDADATQKPDPLPLHVVAKKGTNGITLHNLKVGPESVSLSVGVDGEEADAWANGKSVLVDNLVKWIRENPVLNAILDTVLLAAFAEWVRRTCFQAKKKAEEKT